MDEQIHQSGGRVEKFCAVCGEERGHVAASVNKRGRNSRVSCPKCGTSSTFKAGGRATQHAAVGAVAPDDRAHTYRPGRLMTHPVFGHGEVAAVLDSQRIDVLFPDRLRRLVHARA